MSALHIAELSLARGSDQVPCLLEFVHPPARRLPQPARPAYLPLPTLFLP